MTFAFVLDGNMLLLGFGVFLRGVGLFFFLFFYLKRRKLDNAVLTVSIIYAISQRGRVPWDNKYIEVCRGRGEEAYLR